MTRSTAGPKGSQVRPRVAMVTPVAFFQQGPYQLDAEKAGASQYENFHSLPFRAARISARGPGCARRFSLARASLPWSVGS